MQKFRYSSTFIKTWTRKHDFNQPNNTVAALLSNEDNNSAIVVITDADFMEDKFFDPFYISNINFAVNSIEWLADDSGLIKLRNKYIENQSLKVVSDSYRRFLKYTNFFPAHRAGITYRTIPIQRNIKRKRLRRSQPGRID